MIGEVNNGFLFCGLMEYVVEYQGYIDFVLVYLMYWILWKIFQEKLKDFIVFSVVVKSFYIIYKDR